jgi:hypothetical protein
MTEKALCMTGGGDRIIFDISSIARWNGPAVGIARVEHALATHALTHRPDIVLSIYDARSGFFHAVDPAWGLKGEIGGTALNATYAHAETPVWIRRGDFHPPQGATDPQPIGAVSLTDLALNGSNWRVRRPRVRIG